MQSRVSRESTPELRNMTSGSGTLLINPDLLNNKPITPVGIVQVIGGEPPPLMSYQRFPKFLSAINYNYKLLIKNRLEVVNWS